jgi:hypothetical protein
MTTELKLYFPKQVGDYKRISREIRQNPVFGEFVTSKSKDRRYLILDFKSIENYDTLSKIFFLTMDNLEYKYEII